MGVSTRGAVATGPRLRGAVRLSLWLWERGNVAVSATFPRFHSPGTAAAWFHLRLGGRRSGRRISHIRGTRFAPSAEITHPKPGRAFRCGAVRVLEDGRRLQILCDDGRFLLFANHGGAINEAYSDIIGTAVEFSVHDPGVGPLRADYVMGEDTGQPIRSLENPLSIAAVGSYRYPDAWGHEFRFLVADDGEFIYYTSIGFVAGQQFTRQGSGYDGVHWNSTILSHAFYLAIEGGQNRSTGLTVQGVGAANRHQVERAFFRSMTHLMPARTSFRMTAAVIRQSAVDLFGAGSATHRAIDQALNAVGLRSEVQQ